MRYSHQRKLISDLLKGCTDHPTADILYERAREIEPNISLGTVYRNLKLLGDNSELITLETEDKKIHYDGNIEEHSHFICRECGKIIDLFVKTPVPKELIDEGVSVKGAKCVYYGLCRDCINKKNN